jgi:UDP-3-O-[3-hydroxymyristoyl] N-acetylglucosamine deacetylase
MSSVLYRSHMTGFEAASAPRRTLKAAIGCVGRGLHTGADVHVTLRPAASGAGITFRRTDLNVSIPARYDLVSDTRLCTVISAPDQPQARIGTIEHLMAALAASRIDDVTVDVDGPELPILDGSAAPFIFLIESAGATEHGGARDVLEILRPLRVANGEAFAELRPHGSPYATGFDLSLAIDFAASAIGRQAFSLTLSSESFAQDLAPARTFTQAAEIEALREAGLAKGGSLANAIVVDGPKILNPEGLRFPDEFVRHKLLDVIGDLALAGAPIAGRFIGNRTGHALNNQLLHTLFANPANFRLTRAPQVGSPLSMAAAAAPVK